MATRKTENAMLKREGYHQGIAEFNEPACCDNCGRTVSGTHAWRRHPPLDPHTVDAYCRRCAMLAVFIETKKGQ